MALILATALVVAVLTPEANQHVSANPRGSLAPLPIAHEFMPRYERLQATPSLRTLPATGFTDTGPDPVYLEYAKPPEPMDHREPRALLPPLSFPDARRDATPGGGAGVDEADRAALVAKWAPTLAPIRHCESRGVYAVISKPDALGLVYYGAYQFLPSTWASVGGVGLPSEASPEEQDYRAALMLERGRRGEWGC